MHKLHSIRALTAYTISLTLSSFSGYLYITVVLSNYRLSFSWKTTYFRSVRWGARKCVYLALHGLATRERSGHYTRQLTLWRNTWQDTDQWCQYIVAGDTTIRDVVNYQTTHIQFHTLFISYCCFTHSFAVQFCRALSCGHVPAGATLCTALCRSVGPSVRLSVCLSHQIL